MRATRQGVVVLLSGGLDSVAALHHSVRAFAVTAALSFHYGSKHNDRELIFAARQCHQLGVPHVIIRLDFIAEHFESALLRDGGEIPLGHYEAATMKQTVVPFRNGIMLAIATGFAESHGAAALVIAAHAGDHAIYPDCRESFLDAMSEAAQLGTYAGVEIRRPFINLRKSEIVSRGHELGVNFAETWSCYVGGEVHCGECGTCVERREAFVIAGVNDPTLYASGAPLPRGPAAA